MKKVKLMIYLTIALLAIILTGSAWARGGHGGGGHHHYNHAGGGHRHHGHAGGGYRHEGHRHFGHRHNHNRFNFGINLGGGGFYTQGFYGGGFYNRGFAGRGYYGYRNYGYRDPFYYPRYNAYSQAVIVPSTPPVYIQQEEVRSAPAQPQTNYWHYCRDSDGYYPYVKKCPGGWLQVAPQPAQ